MGVIPLVNSKMHFAFVDDADYQRIMSHVWRVLKSHWGHLYAFRLGVNGYRRIFMHHEVKRTTQRIALWDHKDGNGLNNQNDNLEKSDFSKNRLNPAFALKQKQIKNTHYARD